MLWLLYERDQVRLRFDPIPLVADRRSQLAELLSWIEEPHIPQDSLHHRLTRDDAEEVLGATESEVVMKLDLVAELLRSEVDSE